MVKWLYSGQLNVSKRGVCNIYAHGFIWRIYPKPWSDCASEGKYNNKMRGTCVWIHHGSPASPRALPWIFAWERNKHLYCSSNCYFGFQLLAAELPVLMQLSKRIWQKGHVPPWELFPTLLLRIALPLKQMQITSLIWVVKAPQQTCLLVSCLPQIFGMYAI